MTVTIYRSVVTGHFHKHWKLISFAPIVNICFKKSRTYYANDSEPSVKLLKSVKLKNNHA